MEKVLSENEKIRKAEEIYNRRKTGGSYGVRVATNTVNKGKTNDLKTVKKLVLQICICVVLYIIIYLIQNSNYFFSEAFIQKAKEFLTYDINVKEQIDKFGNQFNIFGISSAPSTTSENETATTTSEAETTNTKENTVEDTLAVNETVKFLEDTSSYNQMQEDAKVIKEKYSLTVPLKGEITSPFGTRNVAPKYHIGTDIGANTGTEIVSAMDGKVILCSDTGDYGKHLKIQSEDGDLVTLYAHCSKLHVKKGDKVKKGQKIAEVGESGNATGPHLHLEILYKDRLVNPEYLMEF